MERQFKGKSLFVFPSDYTVVDIETTGLNSGFCEIIEVSAIRVRGERVDGEFSSLIKPNSHIDAFITDLTGISDQTVKDAPPEDVVLPSFYEFAGKDILIGHNVHFDVNFLYDALLKYGYVLDNDFVDTLRLARRALPYLPNHRQVTVAEHFGVDVGGSHRALRDCEICNANYLNLKKIFSRFC